MLNLCSYGADFCQNWLLRKKVAITPAIYPTSTSTIVLIQNMDAFATYLGIDVASSPKKTP